MRSKKLSVSGAAAIWAVLVIGSYNLYACCVYVWGGADVCRRMTPDTVASSVTYQGVECDISANSLDDDLATTQFNTDKYTCGSAYTWCLGDTTYCGVAYHCGLTDTDIKVYYGLPSGGAVVYGSCGNDCPSCPGNGDPACPL